MIINSFSGDFEKKLKALEDEVGYFKGVNLLVLLRRLLKFRYMSKRSPEFVSTNHSKRSFFDIIIIVRSVLLSLFSLRFLFHTSTVKHLFLGFSRRSPGSDGKLYDHFHDPIIDVLDPNNCLMIERPFKLGHFSNRASRCKIIDYDIFVYLSVLLAYVMLPIILLTNKKTIDVYVKQVNHEFGYHILSRKVLAKVYCMFVAESFFARVFLRIIKPRNLVVTSRWLHYPLLYEAKKFGIQSFELQHGCVMPENFFYCKFNESQFEVGLMLVFSDYWKQSHWNTENVATVGLNKKKDRVSSEKELSSVLVISQPEISTQLNNNLYAIAMANPELTFEIKLHPQDMANYTVRYSDSLSLDNVAVVLRVDVNTETLTTMYQLVLGFTSSVLFEAYHLGGSVGIIYDGKNDIISYKEYYGEAINCFHLLQVGEKIATKHFERIESDMKFYDELNKELITELLK